MVSGQRQSYERSTQALIQRIYDPSAQRQFHAYSLALIIEALDAEGGAVVAQSVLGGAVRLALRMPPQLRVRQAALLRRCGESLASEAPLGFSDGAGFGLELRCSISIRSTHQGAGATLWLVGRAEPFAAREIRRARVLGEHLGFAGELALNARPPSPTHSDREAGLFTPKGAAAPDVNEQLSHLPADVADCARLAARGYTNAEIAANLAVSEATVARRLNRIYQSLGIAGRHELDIKSILSQPKPSPRASE